MKKCIFAIGAVLIMACQTAGAWGKVGHEIVIAVAQRHLSQTTKDNLAKYFDYDLKEDAVWMDKHRKDEPIAYTTAWHVYNVDEKHNYDPNPRLGKEDLLYSLALVDYNLAHYQELTDSAVVMNVRMLIHFVGDMHCPVHAYVPGPRNFWQCYLGDKKDSFHSWYDKMPGLLYPGVSADEEAAMLDNAKRREIKRITKGGPLDWVHDCADSADEVFKINAPLTTHLDPDTVEKSREIVDIQLRNAGYRLAVLLNKYFGK